MNEKIKNGTNYELLLDSKGLNNRLNMSEVTLMSMLLYKISQMCECEHTR